MSGRKAFNRFMIEVEIASNGKVGRLTDPEFRCMVTGVWALAAKSTVRGRLLIGDLLVEPADVARQARCTTAVAKRTMAKMRELGMLEPDDEFGCERVHDWDHINPPPKTDNTAAERQQRRRDRLRALRDDNGTITPVSRRDDRDGHADEVEVEGERKTPPTPPRGERARDKDRYEEQLARFVAEHFPQVPPGLVAHHASQLRSRRVEPTVERLRPLIEEKAA